MNLPFLSIIVPVYNIEKYLRECIDSVLNQQFKDFELVLVDDGSIDNSGSICDEYAKRDNRIKVIHKKNGGLSDARNCGINNATGYYLYFLDGDDFLTADSLSDIHDSLCGDLTVDMLICRHNNCINNSITLNTDFRPIDLSDVKSGTQLLHTYINNSVPIPWGAWQSVFKRQVITDNFMEFEKGLIGAEDCDFFNRYILKASKFKFLDKPVFNYRQAREGSITAAKSLGFIYGELKTFVKYFRYFSELKEYKICSYYANWFCNAAAIIFYLKDEHDIRKAADFVRQNRDIFAHTRGLKYTFAKFVWRIFGYYRGSKVLKTIQTIIHKGKL